MDLKHRGGHLDIGFGAEPFDSTGRLLLRSARLYLSNLPFLAAVTLAVFLPVKLAIQFGCYLLNVPMEGLLSYFLLEIGDLVLDALVIPAAVYGLVARLHSGGLPALGECFRWGRRQWAKTLWNKVKVEITITLSILLFIVPGLMAMVRLVFTDVVVAIEADLEPEPLQRSRELGTGCRWRIFQVVFPLVILDFAASFLILNVLPAAAHSRWEMAVADSLLAVGEQWFTVAALLMYLGLTRNRAKPAEEKQ